MITVKVVKQLALSYSDIGPFDGVICVNYLLFSIELNKFL